VLSAMVKVEFILKIAFEDEAPHYENDRYQWLGQIMGA